METRIEKLLTFDGIKPSVIGTAGSGLKNYGDIDVNVILNHKFKDDIIEKIKKIDTDFFIIEIKVQKKDKKIKFKNFQDFHNDFNDFYSKDVDFIKVDFKVPYRSGLEAYEVLFFLNPKKSSHIKETIKELLKSKLYFKALKRYFSLARKAKDEKKIKLFKDFIESDVGAVGRFVSLLESVDELEKAYGLSNELKDIKQEWKKSIKKAISKDRLRFNESKIEEDPVKWVNEKARDFLRKNRLIT